MLDALGMPQSPQMDPARDRRAHAKDRGDVDYRPALVLAPKRPFSMSLQARRSTAPKPMTKMQEMAQRIALLERQVWENIEIIGALEYRLDAQRKRKRSAA